MLALGTKFNDSTLCDFVTTALHSGTMCLAQPSRHLQEGVDEPLDLNSIKKYRPTEFLVLRSTYTLIRDRRLEATAAVALICRPAQARCVEIKAGCHTNRIGRARNTNDAGRRTNQNRSRPQAGEATRTHMKRMPSELLLDACETYELEDDNERE